MICRNVIVICLFGPGFVSAFRYNGEEYDHYRGPPAPLNPDGTVAHTPEYERIRNEHQAAFEREYQKIRNSIKAVDPYSTPNTLKTHGNVHYEQYLPEIHEYDTYDSSAPVKDEGQYYTELYEKPYSSLYDDGQYRPHLYENEQHDGNQYEPPSSTQGTSYRTSYDPAPLNADGTVAHTPEYNAIASSFLAYHGALSRPRRSAERYQGPLAPLNQDLTVDHTPEVKHVSAAHFTAIANQIKRLQATAAHPDRSSPPSKGYSSPFTGQHNLFVPQQHHQGLFFRRKK